MKKRKGWRFLYTGKNDAFFNMALDEALLTLCQEKGAPPVLRIYQWEPKAVSIGYSQKIEKSVDLKKCKENNVDVVRRITGGRAVLHGNDLTYSICAAKDYFDLLGESVNETYKRISLAFLKSLELLNIEGEWQEKSPGEDWLNPSEFSKPCFSSSVRYEIKVAGKKLMGSAQRRFQNSFIQQGSMPLNNQNIDLIDLLPAMGNDKREKIKLELKKRSVSIQGFLNKDLNLNEIISAVRSGFGSFFSVNLVADETTSEELELTKKLMVKYKNRNWNFRR
jgi:lipoate-protein ligase A